jgi:hypothetical protein
MHLEQDSDPQRESDMQRLLITVLASIILAVPAFGAQKPKHGNPPAAIDVTNGRTISLTRFEIVTPGENSSVVGKLTKPLTAGGKTRIAITKPDGCEYLARWEFEDAGDEATVNICEKPKVVLTE